MDKVLIMAGGRGKRLRPLTKDIPKPLVKINNKPVIYHQIDLLKKHNLTNIIVSVDYREEELKNYLGDGKKFGVNIDYVSGSYFDSLKAGQNLTKGNYYLINGDLLFDCNLEEMIQIHNSNKGLMTMAVAEVNDCSQFGRVVLSDNLITNIMEKSENGNGKVNAGIYIISEELKYWIKKYNGWLQLIEGIIKNKKMVAYEGVKRWVDIGTPQSLKLAKKIWENS